MDLVLNFHIQMIFSLFKKEKRYIYIQIVVILYPEAKLFWFVYFLIRFHCTYQSDILFHIVTSIEKCHMPLYYFSGFKIQFYNEI